jgi:replicative DNA helicase Mcm
MAQAGNQELTERFIQFYRNYCRDEIGRLAQEYPNERRSLYVDYNDLFTFDRDIAEDYLTKPDQMQEYAEEALRLYDLPADVSLGQAHVRLRNLPSEHTVDIRNLRVQDDHIGSLVSVQGIVRKATDVRPKVTEAAFECQRCGTMSYIPQSDSGFQEPHECQGCERQGPFKVNHDQSEFVDSQKLRVQESPEGLRGGETPQSIDVDVEDDITGNVTAGDHVTVTGVLHIEQVTQGQEKTALFDLYMDGVTVEMEDEEFEDMDITDEDIAEIVELSNDPDIYDRMVGSLAPAIYGYEEEKLAMVLQLFSGVTKHLPDGSRIRGDLHLLLIGDPGTGKCQKFDTNVVLGDGTERQLGEIVESHLDSPKEIDDGFYQDVDFPVQSVGADGKIVRRRAKKVWKRGAPEKLLKLRTQSGRELEITPSHPLFVQSGIGMDARRGEELSVGEFIALPRHLDGDWDDSLDIDHRTVENGPANRLSTPTELTPELSRLFGYIIGEGHVNDRETSGSVVVTNEDEAIITDAGECFESLGLEWWRREHHDSQHVEIVGSSSIEFIDLLDQIEPAILQDSAAQQVPDCLFRASPGIKREFLRGYIDGEGHVSAKEREIAVASMSRELLEGVRSLLLATGVEASIEPRQNESYRLRISGIDFVRYGREVGFVTDRKQEAAESFDTIPENTNTDVIPGLSEDLRRVRESLALSQFDCGIPRTKYQHYERGDRNPSRTGLERVVSTFENRLEWFETAKERVERGEWDEIVSLRDEMGISQTSLADRMDVTQTAVSHHERNETVPDGGVEGAKAVILDRVERALSVRPDIEAIRRLVEADVSWEPIQEIEQIEPEDDWVYDLEVEGTHNYLSNGVVSHNSQMISYVEQVAPRSVYTSGKGSSAAGLTAAAVRDDFGDGQQWTLEAGALVLADKGIAAVDELDKMDSSDRSAMHEGLEQQQISISKAGINATLKSRCSLLGAANPKYGRFDQYEPIGEQIDLEPALVSRFDLIFTVTDQPDPEHDSRLAEHIIKTNYAGELNTHRENNPTSEFTAEEVENVTEEVAPDIDAELLRKYIAYAKRNVYPTMTDEAKDAIEEFYVDLRAKGADEDAPVPVTARKLEALVRLSEASARVRLSDTVEEEDATRVIGIVRSCLENIGVDPETGEFDADVVETGTSKSQRDRIKSVKAIIEEMEDEYETGAPVEEVLERANEIGMDEEKAESEIDSLRTRGELYEPSPGHYRTT